MRIRTVRDLAAAARGRRQKIGWTQAATASAAGVSRKWLVDFENGKATVDLAAAFRLLDALELTLDAAAPGDAPSTAGATNPRDHQVDLDDLLDDYLHR